MSKAIQYAKVVWTAHDIQTLKDNWTLEQCEQWLIDNECYVRDEMIQHGWTILENMLPLEGDNE
jgi:hypothetical protein